MKKPKTVAELLENPENWTTEAYARDKGGFKINGWYSGEKKDNHFSPDPHYDDHPDPYFDNASCWDLVGAIHHIYRDEKAVLIAKTKLMNTILVEWQPSCIPGFNDHPNTTHADILDLVRKAGI